MIKLSHVFMYEYRREIVSSRLLQRGSSLTLKTTASCRKTTTKVGHELLLFPLHKGDVQND